MVRTPAELKEYQSAARTELPSRCTVKRIARGCGNWNPTDALGQQRRGPSGTMRGDAKAGTALLRRICNGRCCYGTRVIGIRDSGAVPKRHLFDVRGTA